MEPITDKTQTVVATTPPPAEEPKSLEVMRLQNERAMAEFDSPFQSAAAYRHFQAIAEVFSKSMFIPEHFRGKVGDCLIALNLAKNMSEDPLQVMQNIFVVGGRPGFYTSFMIARANRRAGLKSRINWKVEKLEPAELDAGGFKLPNLRVTAIAVDSAGEVIEAWVDSKMAIGEGWSKNSKYKHMAEHMLCFRAAAFLIRRYFPDVMMGYETVEEIESLPPVIPAAVGAPTSVGDILVAANPVPGELTPEEKKVVAEATAGESGSLFDAPAGASKGSRFKNAADE